MPTGDLFPSAERRMKAYHELSDRAKALVEKPAQLKPTITLTREFGCEAFPIAEESGQASREEDRRAVGAGRQVPARCRRQRAPHSR